MLGTVPARQLDFSFTNEVETSKASLHGDHWDSLAASAILVLGSSRSGTTWLAKIFDSHPDILYRHEPDELTRPNSDLDPAEQISTWLRQQGLRTAAKRPNFPKSWRPIALEATRRSLALVLTTVQRLPVMSQVTAGLRLPDLIPPGGWRSVRAAVKLVNWNGTLAARTMPDMRCVFIIRHPCGQVASLLAGRAARQFGQAADGSDSPVDLVAAARGAAQRGIDSSTFNSLPDAAKYAWAWLAFNEPAVNALRVLPNARIVVYEDLCRRPESVSRDLFVFAGLGWHPCTAKFLANSTRHDRPAGYYDVFRATGLVADRWRQTMSQQDQDAVSAVISASPLARFWPGLKTGE